MFKIILLVSSLLILNVSYTYSIVSNVKDIKSTLHCNITNTRNFQYEIKSFFKQLPLNVTKLTVFCDHKLNISLDQELFPINLALEYLHFRGFFVKVLPNSFSNLKRLKYLGFENCTLKPLKTKSFGILHNLLYLNLSSNAIKVFNNFLVPSSKIIDMNLSNNNISLFNENMYETISKFVDIIDIRNNPITCHCANKWIYNGNYDKNHLKVDVSNTKCNISSLNICKKYQKQFGSVIVKDVYSFESIVIECPIKMNVTLETQKYWISPHNEWFGINYTNNVKFSIQPLLIETYIWVNKTSNALHIKNFRGYFRGNWTCRMENIQEIIEQKYLIISKVHTKTMFDFSITIGFSFAGAWLLVAICVGLVQYCKETSCCRHKIDYNKSNLFEKRYVQTVIPVPFVDSISESSSNDSDINCTKPLNRMRYDSHNNDVQLIFKDQELADEYAQMLSQLKEASETGDEHFKDRLTTLRTRFSNDFNKMRFELKRGMESLKSNSTAAAHKLRKSVGHMKDHMKSFSEFCGTSSMAQSISIVVISDNSNINDPNHSNYHERHQKKVFRFFEPL